MARDDRGERKRRLVAELLNRLRADHAALARAQRATVAAATSEEAKSEHSKDTRALEQTYLARGQAQRVEEVREGLSRVAALPLRVFAEGEPIAVGAVVEIEEEGDTSILLLVPYGGGIRLSGDIPDRPITNCTFLFLGALIASFVGTTGASILLIRPLLQINS